MEPIRPSRATLVDLLDRILDKGLVVHADIIISVAGIPLIGVNLRAALAGMETMQAYGLMAPRGEANGSWSQRSRAEPFLREGEPVLLAMPGSHYYAQGSYSAWRWGWVYLTPQRLFLYHGVFGEVLFQILLEDVRSVALQRSSNTDESCERQLRLTLADGSLVRVRARDVVQLKETLVRCLAERGVGWEEDPAPPNFVEERPSFLVESEEIAYEGKMWRLMNSSPHPLGLNRLKWKPGRLYLTSTKLCWWYEFEKKVAFEVPLEKIVAVSEDIQRGIDVFMEGRVLHVMYGDEGLRQIASFSGSSMEVWEEVLNRVVAHQAEWGGSNEIEVWPRSDGRPENGDPLSKDCPVYG